MWDKLRPGQRPRAKRLNEVAQAAEARPSGTGGVTVARSPAGLQIDARQAVVLSARITGASGSAYAWTEVYYDFDAAAWADLSDGRTGTTSSFPARERNGVTGVATGTRVDLELDPSGEFYLFDAPPSGGGVIPSGSTLEFASGSTLQLDSGSTVVMAGPTWNVTQSTTATVSTGQVFTIAAGGTGAVVITAPTTFGNTALRVYDTNASHALILSPGSDLTAQRTFTITTGDADRTLSLGGNLTTGGAFTTSGGNSLTFTTTGATSLTLPTSGYVVGTASGTVGVLPLYSSATGTLSDSRVGQTGDALVTLLPYNAGTTSYTGVAVSASLNRVTIYQSGGAGAYPGIVLNDGTTDRTGQTGTLGAGAKAQSGVIYDLGSGTVLAAADIGVTVQGYDADLAAIAALAPSNDDVIQRKAGAWTNRTMAQLIADLAALGTTFQPLDADLTTLAGLTATTDNFIVSVSSAWASRTPSQVRTTLGLVVGTNVQAWDADLDALAALTGTNTIYYRSAANTWTAVTIGTNLTFSGGTLSSSGALDINGLTETTPPAMADTVPRYSVAGTANKKARLDHHLGMARLAPGGRLTLTSGSPIADNTNTTIYYTPYVDDMIWLWDSTASAWVAVQFTEQSLALGTMTGSIGHDVFGYLSSGSLAIEKLAWTSAAARATAVTYQDGRLCKSGDKTRLLLGSFYSTSTTQTADTTGSRCVSNLYNQRPRHFHKYEATASWTYNSAAWQKYRNQTANIVEVFCCTGNEVASAKLNGMVQGTNNVLHAIGIGLDSDTPTDDAGRMTSLQTLINSWNSGAAFFDDPPGLGYHTLRMCEYSSATGTNTFYGYVSGQYCNGLSGYIMG